MNGFVKIVTGILSGLILLSGCNNKNKESSPYEDILNQQPFVSLTDSISKQPGDDGLYFRRAVLLNKNNFPEPALADFQKAWSLKKDERYALGISNILLEKKKPEDAIAFLKDAVKELPNGILLQITFARCYDLQEKTDEALRTCNDILQNYPDRVDVLKFKADLLDKYDESDSAIAVLEHAYRVAPFDIDLNYLLAFKYAENKNPKVVLLCDSLITKDSLKLHAEPYYYKGIYYSNIRDKTKALAMFELAIQHDYYFLNAYIEKGRVQYEQKKFADALKAFQLVQTISPKFADAYFWMGKCEEALGQREEAKLDYQRAYGLDQTFTEAKEAADKLK